jgi:hypothetical protein
MKDILLLFAGAVITWFWAKYYYWAASQDLKKEAARLRKQTETMLRIMEDAKFGELVRDEEGQIVGRVATLKFADVAAKSHVSKPEIDKPE